MSCPHIKDCKQRIERKDLEICLESVDPDWSFEDCFKYDDLKGFVVLSCMTPSNWMKEKEEEKRLGSKFTK